MGILKKITRPITKVLDKVIPNEIKPFLPYAAAAAPFLLPAGATIGSLSPAMTRALIAAGSSAVASGAEEGSEGIDFKTALLSGGLGYLADPTTAKGLDRFRTPIPGPGDTGMAGGELSFLDKAKNLGITGLQKGSEFLSKPSTGIKDFAGKYAVTGGVEGTGQAMRFAERAKDAEQAALDEFNRLASENAAATYDDYYSNILRYMDLAGFTTEEAEAAAERTLRGLFAKGGRVGYLGGGPIYPRIDGLSSGVSEAEQTLQEINQRLQSAESALGEGGGGGLTPLIPTSVQTPDPFFGKGGGKQFINHTLPKTLQIAGGITAPLNSGFMQPVSMNNPLAPDLRAIPEFMKDPSYQPIQSSLGGQNIFANGGRVGYNQGGDTNKDVTPPGMEMDLRVGGFIPIGQAERADDVKARVGLNEFVMTADAVRGMGNGDVREGARRMYQLMDKLEPIGRMTT